ncbi:MAG TPA: OsmC family protein [Fimbriimonadaceae bacterium]|nr:OsmC family protein [Fimbriimonadaceae bacterium]
MASVHEYPVVVDWQGGRDGSGTCKGERSGVESPLSVPPEFQGPGNGTNPEELLTSAIASCYTITFGIIAANRKVPVRQTRVRAVGEVEQAGVQNTFRAVRIEAEITLEPDATEEHAKLAEDLAHKADSYCLITNAVRDKVGISVNVRVSR